MNRIFVIKCIVFLFVFLNSFSSTAQLLLTSCTDVDLKESNSESSKIIYRIPNHKNMEFLKYIPIDDFNGSFFVRVYGVEGYVSRSSVNYDINYYLSFKPGITTLNSNNIEQAKIVFSENKRKIDEERIWSVQNVFQNESFSDLMTNLQNILPKDEVIENKNEGGGYCIKSLTSYNLNAVSSSLSTLMMNMINNEFSTLENFFGIDVTLLYSDSGPAYFPSSKTIITGNEYVNFSLKARQNSKYVNEVYKAVLAHEFAHGLQDVNGMFDYWHEGKQPELHADFLAGFYIGKNGLISRDKLTSFADEFFDLGDNSYFDAGHHGTPKERTCAFLEGYKVAVDYDFNIYQAYNVGIDYIKLLYPCDAFAIIREYSKTEYNNTNYTLPTGGYIFSSTVENMVFCNLYKQPLGEAMPGNDLVFNNLTPGSYIVIPARKKRSGRLKYFRPYTFLIKPNHFGKLTIEEVGVFSIRSFGITF